MNKLRSWLLKNDFTIDSEYQNITHSMNFRKRDFYFTLYPKYRKTEKIRYLKTVSPIMFYYIYVSETKYISYKGDPLGKIIGRSYTQKEIIEAIEKFINKGEK